ncbi:MAG: hypothetical protein A4E31_01158 [Methanomassiliicoccales archaeon PtaU1.Bin030]|nr:MAG: hypothetical protein A4E31_01158 [Methanomassiliicoccales archaeon PtaU1.Bin030]
MLLSLGRVPGLLPPVGSGEEIAQRKPGVLLRPGVAKDLPVQGVGVCHHPILEDGDGYGSVLDEGTELGLALLEGLLGPVADDSVLHLVLQLYELGPGVTALLNVEGHAVVKGLDDDLLPAFAGEEDERDAFIHRPHVLEEVDAVHFRHLVIGDYGVVLTLLHHIADVQG